MDQEAMAQHKHLCMIPLLFSTQQEIYVSVVCYDAVSTA
jgi:hypothetical protein